MNFENRKRVLGTVLASLLKIYQPPGHLDDEGRQMYLRELTLALNRNIPVGYNEEQFGLICQKICETFTERHKYRHWPNIAEIIDWCRDDFKSPKAQDPEKPFRPKHRQGEHRPDWMPADDAQVKRDVDKVLEEYRHLDSMGLANKMQRQLLSFAEDFDEFKTHEISEAAE